MTKKERIDAALKGDPVDLVPISFWRHFYLQERDAGLLADALLAFDGCLNFFAGPSNPEFSAKVNFYNVHYAYTHLVGTSGGNTDDMKEAIRMMSDGLDPAGLVTHIGGLNAVIEATLHLPEIPGGKKLIYNHIEMPLTPISDFAEKGKTDPLFAELHRLCEKHKGLWNVEAEQYLLKRM